MSYEGYTQVLCKNGHLSCYDCRDDESPVCAFGRFESPQQWQCRCGASIAWWNDVDDTNCDSYGKVDLEIATDAVVCECPHCKNKHYSSEETYKIPPEGAGHHVKD